MDLDLLNKHIENYVTRLETEREKHLEEKKERTERIQFYQSWTKERLLKMDENDLYEYISKLWAMMIWGNKRYVVDKLIQGHGLNFMREQLAYLVWDDEIGEWGGLGSTE